MYIYLCSSCMQTATLAAVSNRNLRSPQAVAVVLQEAANGKHEQYHRAMPWVSHLGITQGRYLNHCF